MCQRGMQWWRHVSVMTAYWSVDATLIDVWFDWLGIFRMAWRGHGRISLACSKKCILLFQVSDATHDFGGWCLLNKSDHMPANIFHQLGTCLLAVFPYSKVAGNVLFDGDFLKQMIEVDAIVLEKSVQ